MEIKLTRTIWKSFRLSDNKLHWLYTNELNSLKLENKEYFNKDTQKITIYKGYETKENQTEPLSKTIYYVCIEYKISNYFGDKSGTHVRTKSYVVIDGKFYQQLQAGEVKEIKRMSKELKGVLKEIGWWL